MQLSRRASTSGISPFLFTFRLLLSSFVLSLSRFLSPSLSPCLHPTLAAMKITTAQVRLPFKDLLRATEDLLLRAAGYARRLGARLHATLCLAP